jgi:hypothetical protein
MTYKLENMVVLRYTRNTCYVEVVPLADALDIMGLKVNFEKGEWSSNVSLGVGHGERSTRKIAQPIIVHRAYLRSEGAPIGVYDRTNIDHLNAMASATINATESNMGSRKP